MGTSLSELRVLADQLAASNPAIKERACLRSQFAHEFLLATSGNVNAMFKEMVACRERKQFETNWKNVPEKLMLIVTELAEAMDAYRYLDDVTLDNLHTHKQDIATGDFPEEQRVWLENFVEELADVFIRLGDLCYSLGIDMEQAAYVKMATNELRSVKHGKQR